MHLHDIVNGDASKFTVFEQNETLSFKKNTDFGI